MDGREQMHQGLAGGNGFRPVYTIFEGGGAKGIAHIGALKALENEQLESVGVAGSSAGAIVAALTAVGYKSDDLFDADARTDILQPRTPIGVLGLGTWRRFRLIRRGLLPLAAMAAVALIAAIVLVVTHQRGRFAFAALAVAIVCLGTTIALIWPILTKRGLFDSTELRSVLNRIFLDKVNANLRAQNQPEKPEGHKVRFADIDPAVLRRCSLLKIIVSDVRSGELRVFDRNTPDAVLADVVAASASIPFAIRPPMIEGFAIKGVTNPIYVDGGLISNLPVWSFTAEKRALERQQGGPPVPIIAFSLDGPTARNNKARMTPLAYLVKVISTGIFGSQQIIQRFVPDLLLIALRSSLTTMRFDCDRNAAVAAFDAGYRCASRALLLQRRVAEVTTKALESILADVRAVVAEQRRAQGAPMPRLRINLVDPIDERKTAFRIAASVGMDGDPDDRLELDGRNILAPKAYFTGVPQYEVVAGLTADGLAMTKYERALVCPKLRSVLCLPVFAANSKEPERVLCIDSTDSLKDIVSDSSLMKILGDRSVTASRSMILGLTGVS